MDGADRFLSEPRFQRKFRASSLVKRWPAELQRQTSFQLPLKRFGVKSKVQYSRRRVSMNTKLALATLLVSFALSCSVSQGQLLDRMLTKAGCSACGTTSGCGGEVISDCGAADPCGSRVGICDRIKGRMAGGCGCASAPVSDCGCSVPEPQPVADCGCSAPAPAPVADCGCSAPAPVADCGCDAPAASCGCSGSIFGKLRNRFDGTRPSPAYSPCGCDTVPAIAAPCGCSTPALAPVADCGCSAPATSTNR